MTVSVMRADLNAFLSANPFGGKFTDGLFFRDKMRAIHYVAPEGAGQDILEVGGGESGLTKLLYPGAQVTNLDIDPRYAQTKNNLLDGQNFISGDATDMQFEDASFDMVTLFDLLEHVEDDKTVAKEAIRVLKPGGAILVSTPDSERWRFPYYKIFSVISPTEESLFEDWGHVRRGYTQNELDQLFSNQASVTGAFINPWLAVSHDIAFSKLPKVFRLLAHVLVAPVSFYGWFRYGPDDPGTEIVARWEPKK